MNDCIIEPFKVLVRIRPSNNKEESTSPAKKSNKNIISVKDNQLVVNDHDLTYDFLGKKEKMYTFDNIFQEKDKNHTIFNQSILNMIDNIYLGYNSTALAYGVTGAGKTHTMFGDLYNINNQEKGIATYATEYLFQKLQTNLTKEYIVKISYLEIYNEQVIDLLNNNISPLLVIEDPNKGIYVPELSEFKVRNSNELIKHIIQGNTKRTMAPTGQNQFSSRSHAILQIAVEQRKSNSNEMMSSKFMIVDLAGSERGNLEKGIRLQEGANINKSLLALGNCINLLSDKTKKNMFVPYRDSKLTRLLKESLGGNIITVMIACISPLSSSYEDIVNTLNYASRARKIQNKINKNFKEYDEERNYKEVIHSLKVEITQLKEVIFKQSTSSNEFKKINNNTFQIQSICNVTENIRNENSSFKIEKEKKIVENILYQDKIIPFNSINMNKDIYKTLINNFMPTNHKLEDIERNIELYFSVKTLNEHQNIGKDYEFSKQFSGIKSFYEKYFDIINLKLTDMIKQDLIYNYNLKELNELKESHQMQIHDLLTYKENVDNNVNSDLTEDNERQYWKINEELRSINKINYSNERERDKLIESIEKNKIEKNKLRDILWKLSRNLNKNEISNLSQVIEKIEKEKSELQKQNYNNQIHINQLIKENENLKLEMSKILKENGIFKKTNSDLYERLQILEKQNGNFYENMNHRPFKIVNKDKRSINKSYEANPLSRNKKENLNKLNFPLKSGKFVYFLGKEGCKYDHKWNNLVNNEDSKEEIHIKSNKTSHIPNSFVEENDKKIEIDIQMITPLKNFKIDFDKCQFLKMDDSNEKKVNKKVPLKRIEGYKEKKYKDNGGNFTARVSFNHSQKGKNEKNKNDKKFLKKNDFFNTIACLEKNNFYNIQMNLNKSLSLSKVNYKNEICFDPENEEDFINTKIFEDFGIRSPKKKYTDKKLIQNEESIIKCIFPKNKLSTTDHIKIIKDKSIVDKNLVNNSPDKKLVKPKAHSNKTLRKNYMLKDLIEKSPFVKSHSINKDSNVKRYLNEEKGRFMI